jgi:hypothetical protein
MVFNCEELDVERILESILYIEGPHPMVTLVSRSISGVMLHFSFKSIAYFAISLSLSFIVELKLGGDDRRHMSI